MSDAFIGEVRLFAGRRAPNDWHFCDGTLLPISGNEALYSLLGTIYGGDGRTQFAIPDLRGRLPISQGKGPDASQTTHVLGSSGGSDTVTLTEATFPTHSHGINASSNSVSTPTPGPTVGFGTLASPMVFYIDTAKPMSGSLNLSPNAISTAVGGNGSPHSNMMPTMGLNYIICLIGAYPSRS